MADAEIASRVFQVRLLVGPPLMEIVVGPVFVAAALNTTRVNVTGVVGSPLIARAIALGPPVSLAALSSLDIRSVMLSTDHIGLPGGSVSFAGASVSLYDRSGSSHRLHSPRKSRMIGLVLSAPAELV